MTRAVSHRIGLGAVAAAALCSAHAGLAKDVASVPRLAHPIAIPDGAGLPADATIGQITLNYFELLQRRHAQRLKYVSDDFLCKSATAQIVRTTTVDVLKTRSKADRSALKAGNAEMLTLVATEVAGRLDGVDPAAIRTDEAIGPGAYTDGIVALSYLISRCRFS